MSPYAHVATQSSGLEAAYRGLYREAQRVGRTGFLRRGAVDGSLAVANAFVWFEAAVRVVQSI